MEQLTLRRHMRGPRGRGALGWVLLIACATLTLLPRGARASARLCVLIRAAPAQPIEALLWSLYSQPRAAADLRSFVINTDPRQQGCNELHVRTNAFSRRRFRTVDQEVAFLPLGGSAYNKTMYAYDATDEALDAIVAAQAQCEYLLVTNGDNLYSAYLMDAITPLMDKRAPLIAWDFVSHHLRDDAANTHISVAIHEKFIDLGSFAARFEFYNKYNLRFVANAREFTGSCAGFFAADYCMAERVSRLAARLKARVALLHSILMFHQ